MMKTKNVSQAASSPCQIVIMKEKTEKGENKRMSLVKQREWVRIF